MRTARVTDPTRPPASIDRRIVYRAPRDWRPRDSVSLTWLCLTRPATLLTSFLPWKRRARISVWTLEPPRVVAVRTRECLPLRTYFRLTWGTLITATLLGSVAGRPPLEPALDDELLCEPESDPTTDG